MAAKKQNEVEDASEHLKMFKEIISKIQEVEGALNTQESVIEIIRDILRDLPKDSEVSRGLCAMAEATQNMSQKLADAENYADLLCSSITGDNVLYSILLDDLKMYSKPGGLHD